MSESKKGAPKTESGTARETDMVLLHAGLARDERHAALRGLAGRLAHQMRNPLAAVRAACHGLRSEIVDADQRETLDLMLVEIDRMLGFVDATVRNSPAADERPEAIDVTAEISDVIRIATSGFRDPPEIILSGAPCDACVLPRNGLRVSVYSLLEDLAVIPSVTHIAVTPSYADGRAVIRFAVSGAQAGDPGLSNGMTVPVNSFQPVGLLVAERFVRDRGGRLARSDDGGQTQTITLELPCGHG
jgi:two-component system sensor histidine kinase PilS (NtrC family)